MVKPVKVHLTDFKKYCDFENCLTEDRNSNGTFHSGFTP